MVSMSEERQSAPEIHVIQSRPNSAHVRQSRPDYGLGVQVSVYGVPSSFGRGLTGATQVGSDRGEHVRREVSLNPQP